MKPLLALLCAIPLLHFDCPARQPSDQTWQNDRVIHHAMPDSPSDTAPVAVPAVPLYDYDTAQWTELIALEPGITLDLRYATTHNFVKEKLYPCGRCFLRPEVARAIQKAHRELQRQGLGLKMFDCYRPRPIQQKLWDKVPDDRYVTPPWKGSMHNRGQAVDLTIVDARGIELDMGTAYDYFGEKAYHTCTELPREVLANRTLLRELMARHGFRHIRTEWWHYSYIGVSRPLSDWQWKCR